MHAWRLLLIAFLIATLPVQGALAASRALCAPASPGAPGVAHHGAMSHGGGHEHGGGHAQDAASSGHGHSQLHHATVDAAEPSPPPADEGRSCKMCAACSLAAVVALPATAVPQALPEGAIDAPVDHSVPRARAGRLERPPKA